MVLPASFLLFALFSFGCAVGPLELAPETPVSGGHSDDQSKDGQESARPDLLVQPPPAKEAEKNAERKLQTDGRVTSESLPAFVHYY
jgi:hypothetical protein